MVSEGRPRQALRQQLWAHVDGIKAKHVNFLIWPPGSVASSGYVDSTSFNCVRRPRRDIGIILSVHIGADASDSCFGSQHKLL